MQKERAGMEYVGMALTKCTERREFKNAEQAEEVFIRSYGELIREQQETERQRLEKLIERYVRKQAEGTTRGSLSDAQRFAEWAQLKRDALSRLLRSMAGMVRSYQWEEKADGEKDGGTPVMRLAGIFQRCGRYWLVETEYTLHCWHTQDPWGYETGRRPPEVKRPLVLSFAPVGSAQATKAASCICTVKAAAKRDFWADDLRLGDTLPEALSNALE